MDEIAREKNLADRAYLAQLERRLKTQDLLPHLYGTPWYDWQLEYFNSTDRFICVNAANQIGKSSASIRRCIDWATNRDRWPVLWGDKKPTQMWYFYPDSDVSSQEYYEKWEKEWLPRGQMKDHEDYGWSAQFDKKKIVSIRFNTGVTVYFKTYAMDAFKLQAATVYGVYADEEMPPEFWSEIIMRLNAVDGYFSIVKTSTVDHPFWDSFNKGKIIPEAKIIKVSMFDCLKYANSDQPTPWTEEKIRKIEMSIPDEQERRIRIYGESGFTRSELKYWGFKPDVNYVKPHPLPKDWIYYAGIDIGGGGQGHPSAIAIVGVSPDFKKGRVVKLWRGDGQLTTSTDILKRYLIMRDKLTIVAAYYDHAAKDFHTTAARAGHHFFKADKSHDRGEDILNTAFSYGMLKVFESPEGANFVEEVTTLKKSTTKGNAKDDMCFVAGTLIRAERGELPVESISVGDLVWTRKGLRRVSAVSSRLAEVRCYTMPNGSSITCTENHSFYTSNRGFVPIGETSTQDSFLEWTKCQSIRSFIRVLSLGVTRILSIPHAGDTTGHLQTILKKAFTPFIKKSGRTRTVLFPRVTLFITRITTHLTTRSRTLNWLKAGLTNLTTQTLCGETTTREERNTSTVSDRSLRNGMDRVKVSSGIRTIGKTLLVRSSQWISRVSSVNLHSDQRKETLSFVRTPVSLAIEGVSVETTLQDLVLYALRGSTQTSTRKPRRVLSRVSESLKSKPSGKKTVFNITVEGEHEYYAGGYLVSNCDAIRYAVTQIPWNYTNHIPNAKEEKADDPYEGMSDRQMDYLKEKEARQAKSDLDVLFDDTQDFEEINELYEGIY